MLGKIPSNTPPHSSGTALKPTPLSSKENSATRHKMPTQPLRKAASVLTVALAAALALFASDLVAADLVFNVVTNSALSLGSLTHSATTYFRRSDPLKIAPFALLIVGAFVAIFGQCYIQGEFDPALVPAELALRTVAENLVLPPELSPNGGCTRLKPFDLCPNRNYFGAADPSFWPVTLTTESQRQLVFRGAVETSRAGLQMATEGKNGFYTPSSAKELRGCFEATVEVLCELAWPRCTGVCEPLKPCLDVCDGFCPWVVPLLDLLATFMLDSDAVFRGATVASVRAGVGSCVDLPMADGREWVSDLAWFIERWGDFSLSPQCMLPAITLSNGAYAAKCDQLGADGTTTMDEACCSCGGGVTNATLAALVSELIAPAVDATLLKFAPTCSDQRTPEGTELLDQSCIRTTRTDYGDGTQNFFWANATGDVAVVSVEGEVVVLDKPAGGDASVRWCALSAANTPGCTGFSYSGLVGCALWLNGRCSASGADGLVPSDGLSVRTFRICPECNQGGEAAAFVDDSSVSLSLTLPCSSPGGRAALVQFDPLAAPCFDGYQDAFQERGKDYAAAALAAKEAADAVQAETTRIKDVSSSSAMSAFLVHVVVAFVSSFFGKWVIGLDASPLQPAVVLPAAAAGDNDGGGVPAGAAALAGEAALAIAHRPYKSRRELLGLYGYVILSFIALFASTLAWFGTLQKDSSVCAPRQHLASSYLYS